MNELQANRDLTTEERTLIRWMIEHGEPEAIQFLPKKKGGRRPHYKAPAAPNQKLLLRTEYAGSAIAQMTHELFMLLCTCGPAGDGREGQGIVIYREMGLGLLHLPFLWSMVLYGIRRL